MTRSRRIGKVRMGATVTVSPGGKASIRVMHMRAGRPLISAEHDPHLPALQFHRQARSGAVVAWMRWMTSRTTSPSWAGNWYSAKSPPSSSPRHTCMVTVLGSGPTTVDGRRRLVVGRCRLVADGGHLVLDGHQVASSNRARSSSGIVGNGSGPTSMWRIEGVPPTPSASERSRTRWTKLTRAISSDGFG